MYKKTILFLVLLMLLSGCQQTQERSLEEEKYTAYITYYQNILDAEDKMSSSQCYDASLVINQLSETSYRYDVVIDNAKVAMYNLKVLAIVNDLTATINRKDMMPSSGIFEETIYNMIPNQVNKDKGFIAGVDVSLIADNPDCRIDVMVSWTNADGSKTVNEYLTLKGTVQQQEQQQEQQEETKEETTTKKNKKTNKKEAVN